MRKTIKLPAPQLSQLKEVNIDLDMTGKHFALLATSEGQIPEDIALSIVKDLLEEDANRLTLSELRYLFMLIKINSLENDYRAYISCTHDKKNGEGICGHINELKVKLSDSDLNPTPKNYKVPTITFRTEDTEKEYLILPPTMDMESALYNWFLTIKGKTYEDLEEDKQTSLDFSFIRCVMHLVDKKTNTRLVDTLNDFSYVLEWMNINKYQTIHILLDSVLEVDSYGVQNKVYEITCKECGGKLIFRLPLLDGIIDQ